MVQLYVNILFICLLIQICHGDYIAAVVEYSPKTSNDVTNQTAADTVMLLNLFQYEKFIKDAKFQGAQIIVFPEDGLYGPTFQTRDSIFPYLEEIPNLDDEDQIIPCKDSNFNNRPVLQRASCLALMYEIVLVLDMGDVQYCNNSDPNCPSDGRYQFNTQVAFSEDGELIAKYHKSHLFYETQFDQPIEPDVVYFDTSFGVRFGLMICFDLMFEYPQTKLLDLGIHNFAFSSWWVNVPPVITATQVQQSFSLISQSVLLAANAGTNWYNSGSGIYNNGEPLVTVFNTGIEPTNKLMVSKIITENSKRNEYYTPENSVNSIGEYLGFVGVTPNVVSFIASDNESNDLTVSYGSLTCRGSYNISKAGVNEKFALIAYTGPYQALNDVAICGFIRCTVNGLCSGLTMNSNTFFTYFSVSGNFDPSYHLYPLFAANNTEVVSSKWFSADLENSSFQSNENFSKTLLNASIFGLKWSNT